MTAIHSHGYLPAGRYIVNHDIMHCTADGVVGNELYSGRAPGLSEPDDFIQLHPVLKPFCKDIAGHYRRIGLRRSERVIRDLSLEELSRHAGYLPSVFYFGPAECEVRDDPDWVGAVEFINSKNNFIALAEEPGIDVPQTRCFDSVDDIGEMDIIACNIPVTGRRRFRFPESVSIAAPTARNCAMRCGSLPPAYQSSCRSRSGPAYSSTCSTVWLTAG